MKLRGLIDEYAFWMIALTVACHHDHITVFERNRLMIGLVNTARLLIGDDILNTVIM